MPIPSTSVTLLCDLREGVRREEAWAAFQARYRGVIFGWCLRRGLSADAAEDLTQDVSLKLFEHLPRYKYDPRRGQFRGWLKAVVNNAMTDFWRRQRRQPDRGAGGTAFQERLGDVEGPEAAGDLGSVIEDHAAATAAEVLERVRAKVKDTTWQAFYRHLVDGCPVAEVAAELNLSVVSVYKASYRVKRMLLEEYRDVRDHSGDPLPGPPDAPEAPV